MLHNLRSVNSIIPEGVDGGARPRRSILAFTSFVLGLLGLFPPFAVAAIVLGLIAHKHLSEEKLAGKNLANFGIVLGLTWSVIVAVIAYMGFSIRDA